MRFTSFFVATLPFLGSVFALPFGNPSSDAVVDARSKTLLMREINYVDVLSQLDNSIKLAGTLTPHSTLDEVNSVLDTVNNAFKTAQSELQLNSSKRDFRNALHARDPGNDVSDLLVAIVRDLNSLLSPVEALLSQIPIVGPILKDINTALDAIILGLDKTLGGILNLVAKILKDLGINITPLLSGLLKLLTGILGGS
ncbi:hypothetical protein I308_103756 [Cryptococcus tetragattii IND107]|uniref:Uncharacterized protein n=1 Tax=Cryptococcus tetragattii IND107 TaxID=1296105 RepID=A0ABR3BR56_9TREE